MIPSRRFLLACAGSLLLVPFAAAAQSEPQPETTPETTETPAPPSDENAKEDTAEDNKRICKSVRADPASRRKTRVCRTMEEWRELNIPT